MAKDHPDKSLREVSRLIGMGDKSYYNLKNGIMPKTKLLRILKAFVEREYGLEIKVMPNNKIKLENISIDNNKNSTVNVGNVFAEDARTKYLLDRIIELEKEKAELIEKLSGKKK